MTELDVRESDIREQVRSRYAQAAQAVTAAGGRTALQVVDADQCCAPASTTNTPTAGAVGGGAQRPITRSQIQPRMLWQRTDREEHLQTSYTDEEAETDVDMAVDLNQVQEEEDSV